MVKRKEVAVRVRRRQRKEGSRGDVMVLERFLTSGQEPSAGVDGGEYLRRSEAHGQQRRRDGVGVVVVVRGSDVVGIVVIVVRRRRRADGFLLFQRRRRFLTDDGSLLLLLLSFLFAVAFLSLGLLGDRAVVRRRSAVVAVAVAAVGVFVAAVSVGPWLVKK